MGFITGMNSQYAPTFGSNWKRFMFFGFALIILGLAAISAATFTTLLSVVFIGFLFFLSGAILTFDTFSFWWGKWGGFILHLVIALLYLLVGITLIKHPVISSITFTYLLGIVYVALGIVRLIFSPTTRMPRWGWGFFNGIITLAIGILILANLPQSGMFIIGLFIGIDLLFSGWFYVMSASAAKKLSA